MNEEVTQWGQRAAENLTLLSDGHHCSAAKPEAEALNIHSHFLPGSLAVCKDLKPAVFCLCLSYL